MIAIEIRGVEELERGLATFERQLGEAQERAVRDGSLLANRRLKMRMSDAGGSHPFFGRTGGAGDTLAARSGQSRARITPGGQVVRLGEHYVASVGSPDPHIAFLEEGGTISGSPYLSLPLASSQTAQGVDQLRGRSLRDVPGVFFVRTMGGKLLAAVKSGGPRSAAVTFLRLLVRQVNIRGRHIFLRTREEIEPQIAAIAEREVQVAVRSSFGG